MRVDKEGANKIPHLDGFDEFAISVIDDDPILLAVANINVAVVGIDGQAMHHAEVSRSGAVAKPLLDEFAVLIEAQDACRTTLVSRRFIGVIGALVGVTHANVNIPIPAEGDGQRLPEEPLPGGLIPVAAMSFHADGHEQLALRAYFHYRVAVLVADPDVVLRIDGHAVRFVLMADHFLADGADQLVILVELK